MKTIFLFFWIVAIIVASEAEAGSFGGNGNALDYALLNTIQKVKYFAYDGTTCLQSAIAVAEFESSCALSGASAYKYYCNSTEDSAIRRMCSGTTCPDSGCFDYRFPDACTTVLTYSEKLTCDNLPVGDIATKDHITVRGYTDTNCQDLLFSGTAPSTLTGAVVPIFKSKYKLSGNLLMKYNLTGAFLDSSSMDTCTTKNILTDDKGATVVQGLKSFYYTKTVISGVASVAPNIQSVSILLGLSWIIHALLHQ